MKNIICSLYFILICFITNNNVNSASITLNLACNYTEEKINNNTIIYKYKHNIIYSDGNGKNNTFSFEDFNNTRDFSNNNKLYCNSSKLNTNNLNKNNQYSICNKILNISNNDFAINKIKSYPITNDGNCTINKITYNLQEDLGLQNNSSSVCTFIDRMFISSNVKQISIINKNHLNPIVFIDYDSLYLKNVNINCFRIPYIRLDNIDNSSNTCEIKDINANRYTILQSNKNLVINGKYYLKQPIVIRNKKNRTI